MSEQPTHPVFFDPERKRWPRLRFGMLFLWLVLSVLLGALVVSILLSPALPTLALPGVSFLPHGAHALPTIAAPAATHPETRQEHALSEAKTKLLKERERGLQLTLARPRARSAAAGHPLAIGFFVNWDDTSTLSLKENLSNLDMVIGEWLHLKEADGTLRENDPERTAAATAYIRAHRPEVAIVPLINNWSGTEWEGTKLGRMLGDPKARARVVAQVLSFVQGHGYAGISVDFENLPAKSHAGYYSLLAEFSSAFKPQGLTVSVNVPASDASFDYKKIAASVDLVILMAYDEHWSTGAPGPIASLSWFAKVLREHARDLPADKTIVGIGGYAYDWPKGQPAEERTFEEAVLTARESEGNIRLDPASLNPTFDYADDENRIHHVWMLDAVTAFDQLQVVRALGARGYALWRLGSEDPTLWKFFGKDAPLDADMASQLRDMRFGYDLDYEGKGEILQITAQPQPGERELTFDPKRKLISKEHYTTFPSPYVITRHGAVDHQVSLTFDDGPDPVWTPRILDILAKEQVPGTFFIIGTNGEMHPDLLRREVREGHEIGIHTFTHPNIAAISPTQFQMELTATQRLLASAVGRQSLLFRPPYAVDAEPETPDQVRPIELASKLGYVTVGMQIDPDDWQRPGVDEIVRRSVAAAESGEGNIVLLHDAGGDRTQTIAALPKLIAALRERGFTFVSVAQLLGQTRDQIMPVVPAESRWQTWTDWAAFGFINLAATAIQWLFMLGIGLGVARLLFIGVLAVYQRYRRRGQAFDPDYAPMVAVVVPAFNEEKVIVQTITSLLASDHPSRFEIIVVDDGSPDATFRVARDTFADDPRVRVFTEPNAGKPAALNFGIAQTQAEIIVAMDADTVFARDTISKLVRHLADPRVGAVAGNAKVGNRTNLMTRWQALEYITSQNLDRRAFDVLNCVSVVPGAVGAWRRDLILTAGGFNHETLAEDTDLTLSIRRLGYAIVYEDEAVALTEAPDTVRGFIRQRYRWMFGTMQASWKHRDVLFRRRYGALGFVALPNVLVFQVLFPLVSPIMDFVLIGSLLLAAFDHAQHPDQYSPDALWRVAFYYALFLAVDFLAAALAFALEPKENKWLLVWLVWQRFFYRQLMYYVAIKATLASLRGVVVGWAKLERKATVVQP
ncbi:glycosyltransferase [uncultured Thiodictyon sp.]|uniref:glycosyltransferase n=1 Tax=uncultured Thiodictyon sp. TaxID=1846217 RepID=UPI0025D24036|nr:glycosyltransferase [uncultured Thiodictyon sp.]